MRGSAIVTGAAGFMGSRLSTKLSEEGWDVIIVDALTYAARPNLILKPNQKLEKCDIRDHWALSQVFDKYKPSIVYHLAAESHVCRSIEGPRDFITTNINGTWHVAEECRKHKVRMVHVSTDEVFGEVQRGSFTENTPYAPRSPYAASKASGDHLVRCYSETYGLNAVIVHPSNNFGPNQHEEKLIPRTITRILSQDPVLVYGRGDHRREWLYVDDFCQGVMTLAKNGIKGNSYCLGGGYECSNIDMVHNIYAVINELWPGRYALKLKHTNDRPTDDKRYSMVSIKAKALGFKPQPKLLRDRLRTTVLWYFENRGTKEGAHG
jgi:dTDP-glucose 4,6-dehydratase